MGEGEGEGVRRGRRSEEVQDSAWRTRYLAAPMNPSTTLEIHRLNAWMRRRPRVQRTRQRKHCLNNRASSVDRPTHVPAERLALGAGTTKAEADTRDAATRTECRRMVKPCCVVTDGMGWGQRDHSRFTRARAIWPWCPPPPPPSDGELHGDPNSSAACCRSPFNARARDWGSRARGLLHRPTIGIDRLGTALRSILGWDAQWAQEGSQEGSDAQQAPFETRTRFSLWPGSFPTPTPRAQDALGAHARPTHRPRPSNVDRPRHFRTSVAAGAAALVAPEVGGPTRPAASTSASTGQERSQLHGTSVSTQRWSKPV